MKINKHNIDSAISHYKHFDDFALRALLSRQADIAFTKNGLKISITNMNYRSEEINYKVEFLDDNFLAIISRHTDIVLQAKSEMHIFTVKDKDCLIELVMSLLNYNEMKSIPNHTSQLQ